LWITVKLTLTGLDVTDPTEARTKIVWRPAPTSTEWGEWQRL